MPKKTEIDHYSDKEALDFHIKGKSGKLRLTAFDNQKGSFACIFSWSSRTGNGDR